MWSECGGLNTRAPLQWAIDEVLHWGRDTVGKGKGLRRKIWEDGETD